MRSRTARRMVGSYCLTRLVAASISPARTFCTMSAKLFGSGIGKLLWLTQTSTDSIRFGVEKRTARRHDLVEGAQNALRGFAKESGLYEVSPRETAKRRLFPLVAVIVSVAEDGRK